MSDSDTAMKVLRSKNYVTSVHNFTAYIKIPFKVRIINNEITFERAVEMRFFFHIEDVKDSAVDFTMWLYVSV